MEGESEREREKRKGRSSQALVPTDRCAAGGAKQSCETNTERNKHDHSLRKAPMVPIG